MNQILIAKSVALNSGITGINDINSLADGAIAIFTEDNVMLTAAGVVAEIADKKKIYIAIGTGSATKGAFISGMIPRFGSNYIRKDYVAPVKCIKFIGEDTTPIGALNLPTLVAGDEAFIRIIDTTEGLRTGGTVYAQEVFRYSYVVKTGDVQLTIVTALIDAINNDPNRIVNAAVVDTDDGIQLTAVDFGTTFNIALDGILVNATIIEKENTSLASNASVATTYGEGTSAQIAAMEDAFSSELGNQNRVLMPQLFWSKAARTVDGGTYDQYTITWNGTRGGGMEGNQSTMFYTTIIAFPSGATQLANFRTIMAEVFGNAETMETGA